MDLRPHLHQAFGFKDVSDKILDTTGYAYFMIPGKQRAHRTAFRIIVPKLQLKPEQLAAWKNKRTLKRPKSNQPPHHHQYPAAAAAPPPPPPLQPSVNPPTLVFRPTPTATATPAPTAKTTRHNRLSRRRQDSYNNRRRRYYEEMKDAEIETSPNKTAAATSTPAPSAPAPAPNPNPAPNPLPPAPAPASDPALASASDLRSAPASASASAPASAQNQPPKQTGPQKRRREEDSPVDQNLQKKTTNRSTRPTKPASAVSKSTPIDPTETFLTTTNTEQWLRAALIKVRGNGKSNENCQTCVRDLLRAVSQGKAIKDVEPAADYKDCRLHTESDGKNFSRIKLASNFMDGWVVKEEKESGNAYITMHPKEWEVIDGEISIGLSAEASNEKNEPLRHSYARKKGSTNIIEALKKEAGPGTRLGFLTLSWKNTSKKIRESLNKASSETPRTEKDADPSKKLYISHTIAIVVHKGEVFFVDLHKKKVMKSLTQTYMEKYEAKVFSYMPPPEQLVLNSPKLKRVKTEPPTR